MLVYSLLALVASASAAILVDDPSDILPPQWFAQDNAIKADYSPIPTATQPSDILANITFTTDTSISHAFFYEFMNDTSAILVAEKGQLNLSFVDIIKYGYSSNLIDASFYGFNAAINIANGSVVYMDHMNITTHNGAANIYVYGTGSVAYIDDAFLYSSGPVAHGVYAGGNGTAYVSNTQVYTGGNRCSAFSGDNPAGYLYVSDSVAHTGGIGSAIFYALGLVHGTNIIGEADRAPSVFSDGANEITFTNVDFKAGLLAGTILFSSSARRSGATISFTDSTLTTLGSDMSGMWFGNVIASASLYNTNINTTSGVLVTANMSQVTQEFDYFAGSEENPDIAPAIVTISVAESTLVGDLVAYNGSEISWSLSSYSSWTGKTVFAYGPASFDIALDASSTWTLTGLSTVQNFTSADATLGNVKSAGFDVVYNSSALLNGWLNGETISLPGGGNARPM